MTNKALIAQLKGKMKSRKEAGDDVWLDLERAAAALQEQEWRTDMENAPSCFDRVILFDGDTSRNNLSGEGYFSPEDYEGDGYWHWADNDDIASPTHYRPLPPAPKGE